MPLSHKLAKDRCRARSCVFHFKLYMLVWLLALALLLAFVLLDADEDVDDLWWWFALLL